MTTFTLGAQDFGAFANDPLTAAFRSNRNNQTMLDEARRAQMQPREPQVGTLDAPLGRPPAVAAPEPTPAAATSTAPAAATPTTPASAAPAVPTTPVRFTPGGTTPTLGSDPFTFDPTSDVDRRGLVPGDSFQPRDPSQSQFIQGVNKFAADTQANTVLTNIRYGLSLGLFGNPITGIGSSVASLGDSDAELKVRQETGIITDWYDSPQAEQFFRQNPKQLVLASKDPVNYYKELAKLPGASTVGVGPAAAQDAQGAQGANQTTPATPPEQAAPQAAATKPTFIAKLAAAPVDSPPKLPAVLPTVTSSEVFAARRGIEDIGSQLRVALATGDGARALALRSKQTQLITGLRTVITDAAISTFRNGADPRPLAGILTEQGRASGQLPPGDRIAIARNADGTWQISQRGSGGDKILVLSVATTTFALRQRRALSKAFRNQMDAAALASNKANQDARIKAKLAAQQGTIDLTLARVKAIASTGGVSDTAEGTIFTDPVTGRSFLLGKDSNDHLTFTEIPVMSLSNNAPSDFARN